MVNTNAIMTACKEEAAKFLKNPLAIDENS